MNQEAFRNFPSVLCRYTLSFTSVAVALMVAHLLTSIPGVFVFPFLGAVLVSARCASRGTAVLAILLSASAVAYFFLPPVHSFAVQPSALPFFASFIGCAMALTRLTTETDEMVDVCRTARRSGRYSLRRKRENIRDTDSGLHGYGILGVAIIAFAISALYWAPAALYYRSWTAGLLFALVVASAITVLAARRWR